MSFFDKGHSGMAADITHATGEEDTQMKLHPISSEVPATKIILILNLK
jgi:hypothetical protein